MIIVTRKVFDKFIKTSNDKIIVIHDEDLNVAKFFKNHKNTVLVVHGNCFELARKNKEFGINTCCCETGFFSNSWHIDFMGLFDKSGLNKPDIESIIFTKIENSYVESSERIKNLIRNGSSKYKQHSLCPKTSDFVLIIDQRANDSQIVSVDDMLFKNDWYLFLESMLNMCREFGKKVVIKAHPQKKQDKKVFSLAKEYEAEYGNFSMLSCMKEGQCVLVYNSTAIVDMMVWDTPIFSFGKGYLSNFRSCFNYFGDTTNTTNIGEYIFNTKHIINRDCRDKLLSFLFNTYCINRSSTDDFIKKVENGPRFWEK